MDESTLYDLLDGELLRQWREAIEKAMGETWFFTREKEVLKELEAELNEKNKKLLTAYSLVIEDRMDYLFYNIKIKILNLGIKIGMDLQKAFTEYDHK